MLGALPGIRGIRSALVGGYLWIVFFWLLLDPSLGEGDFEADPYQSAHHLGNEIGPVALGLGATFVAYLIGTFMNEIRGVLSRLYLNARRSAGATQTAEERELIAERQRERRRQAWTRLRGYLASLSPVGRRDKAERKEKPRRGPEQVPTLTIEAAGAAMEIAVGGINSLTRAAAEVLELNKSVQALVRSLSEIRIEPYKPYLSNQGVLAVERYLSEILPERSNENSPGVADVISDFPVIRARLIHPSAETVSEVDRLRAEADFRSAIAPPLLALVVLLACAVSAWWLATLPILATLLMTARTKRRECGDLMADALARRVVEAPSVEIHNAG